MNLEFLMTAKIGIIALTLATLSSVHPDQTKNLIYTPITPPDLSEMGFPEKWSHLDPRGTLWVFWRNDTTVYYSDAADFSTLDITTSYVDYYTIYPSLLLMPQDTMVTIVLVSTLGAFTLYLFYSIRTRKHNYKNNRVAD